jgi:hypothetical protein
VITEPTGGGGVSVTPDNVGTGAPGETVEYGHIVANLGPDTETFNLTAVSSQGWPAFVNPSTIQILGNDSRTVTVTVMIPGGAVSGTVDVTTVTAEAASDPGITDSATDTTTVFGSGTPTIFMPSVFKADSIVPPPPTPTPVPTPTTAPCNLNVPPSGNPAGVDLIVTGISFTPSVPQPGQVTTVKVTIKNQGQTSVPFGNNFYLDFYDNPNPEPPQNFQVGNIAWGVQGSYLPAGASVTFQGGYVFNPGLHRLWAQVDTDNTVGEANENNNKYGCLALNVAGAQAQPEATTTAQPTADRPRETPTPEPIQDVPAAVLPEPTVTPTPTP